ncbi:MAG TPA: hypothetical protein VNV87_18395 [Acidimicrobiales bacterium]|nr:hypothetical protein [Acidimicrobiales bacterium]
MSVVGHRDYLETEGVHELIKMDQVAGKGTVPPIDRGIVRFVGQQGVLDSFVEMIDQQRGQALGSRSELDAMVPEMKPPLVIQLQLCSLAHRRSPLTQPFEAAMDLVVAGCPRKPLLETCRDRRRFLQCWDQPQTGNTKVREVSPSVGVTGPLQYGDAIV